MASVNNLSFWKRWLLRIGSVLLRLYATTIRIRIDKNSLQELHYAKRNTIFLFWHDELFLIWKIHSFFNKKLQMHGLVSPSKDGAWLAAIFDIFKIKSIRGSSKRRGLLALDEMANVLINEAACVAITPDGPRGPRHQLKPGAALLIQKTSANVTILKVKYNKFWMCKTWDKFMIPKPFSTAYVSSVSLTPNFHIGKSPQEITDYLEFEMAN